MQIRKFYDDNEMMDDVEIPIATVNEGLRYSMKQILDRSQRSVHQINPIPHASLMGRGM